MLSYEAMTEGERRAVVEQAIAAVVCEVAPPGLRAVLDAIQATHAEGAKQ